MIEKISCQSYHQLFQLFGTFIDKLQKFGKKFTGSFLINLIR